MDALPPDLPAPLRRRAEAGARWLDERKTAGDAVTVVHHIDADGVSAGAVAIACLRRAGIPHDAVAAKSLDDVHVARIRDGGHAALWFCDFGSTAYMHFPDTPRLVCDHHELVRDGTEEDFPHVNPLLDDLPGDTVSGAGAAYLVAAAHDPANLDLLPTALVGAAADLQDRHGGFAGANAALVAHGVEAGLLCVHRDVGWYGPETRPLRKFLSLARDPTIPGITADRRAAEALLGDLELPLHADGRERCWSDLDDGERTALRTALVARMLDGGHDAATIDGVVRDIVCIAAAARGTPVRELREFGTLLNSTARYGRPEVGLAVAGGDRGDAYTEALDLLTGHRRHLVGALDAFARCGIQDGAALQWVHLEDHVRDTVVGIVCGMALDGLGLARDRPLIGFAHAEDGRTKVSGRAPHEISSRVDLATAMREAAAAVGGQGGGHRGAAGATIPRGSEPAFLAATDRILARQLGVAPAPTSAAAPGATAAPAPDAWATAPGQARLF